MIVGVGVDVVDVVRFAAALERTPALRTRLFTATEQDGDVATLAGRFAAKEALAKALGGAAAPGRHTDGGSRPTIGMTSGGLSWHDAVVVGETVTLTGAARARAATLGVVRWHLSIAHDGQVATAFVVGEG